LVTLPKNCWPTILGSVVIQLYAGECTQVWTGPNGVSNFRPSGHMTKILQPKLKN